MSMHLFKRNLNKRGLILLSLFCIYALALLVSASMELMRPLVSSWQFAHCILLISTVLSLLNPVMALLKPGFSYKGHPGRRHALLLVCGILLILVSSSIVLTNFLINQPYLTSKSMLILYLIVYPLHGVHCLTVYSSYFKGPTSKFGKIYQPYLPIIE